MESFCGTGGCKKREGRFYFTSIPVSLDGRSQIAKSMDDRVQLIRADARGHTSVWLK